MKPPFGISNDARALIELLPYIEGKEPGFICSPRYQVSKGEELLESYEGNHYGFVQASPVDWRNERSAVRVLIGSRGYWITPDLLENLSGRTIDVVESEIGRGKEEGKKRKFLVAMLRGLETPES